LIGRIASNNQKELYQPELILQSGIYSINLVSAARLKSFLNAIPDQYEIIDVHLNEGTGNRDDLGFNFRKKINTQLMLDLPYEGIAEKYSPAFHEKLDQARNNQFISLSSIKPEKVADFYKKHTPVHLYKETKFHAYQRIMYNVMHRGQGFSTGIQDQNGELCAVNFFIYSHGKLMSFLPVEKPEAHSKGAMALLMDLIIRTHVGLPLILDFNVENESQLGKNMGGVDAPFYQITRN